MPNTLRMDVCAAEPRLLVNPAFLVRDINSSAPASSSSFSSAAVRSGGITYFTASDESSGTELWRTEGTAAGTVMVRDLMPGASSSSPSRLTGVGGVTATATATDDAGNRATCSWALGVVLARILGRRARLFHR